ncbi:MAG: hypothetical protein OXU41_07030 [Gammaproteobacteria bacterium]|nr:hypothetical protein [Gammaproteobacteria bacterium]
MKEDILEQLVEDYFQHKGYFTRHNVKFRPARGADGDPKKDSAYSDIDVLGINPKIRGAKHVIVVSCKSWQQGFPAERYIRELKDEIKEKKQFSGRAKWKYFRELAVPKWSRAFRDKIQDLTDHDKFTYYVAVTKLNGDQAGAAKAWREYGRFKKALNNNPIEFLTAETILSELWKDKAKTMAASEVGRLLQVVKASRWNPPGKK